MLEFFLFAQEAVNGGDAGSSGSGSSLMSFFPLIMIFAVFWFLIIAPNRKRDRERRAMIAACRRRVKDRSSLQTDSADQTAPACLRHEIRLCWRFFWCIDGNVVPVAADHALDRSRGGFSIKIHLLFLCDEQGHPFHSRLTAGTIFSPRIPVFFAFR